jgi:hypothetical protein
VSSSDIAHESQSLVNRYFNMLSGRLGLGDTAYAADLTVAILVRFTLTRWTMTYLQPRCFARDDILRERGTAILAEAISG